MNNVSDINSVFLAFGKAIYMFWWIIFPAMFYKLFFTFWVEYVAIYADNSYHKSLKWVILEIIPPRDIERGPKIMEYIFEGISGVTTTHNTFAKYLDGVYTQDRFSLEMVGEEGKVHFYIRIYSQFRNLVEAQVYSKYPDAKIVEVPDYTQKFPKIMPNKEWDLWGTDFEMTLPAPVPIKTYDKFEETVTGETIDPMAALMEVIGTLPPGQHIWMQYAIEPLQEKWNFEKGNKEAVEKLKKKEAAVAMGLGGHFWDVLKNIGKGFSEIPIFATAVKKDESPLEFRLSPMEKELLKATEENLGKLTYRTKMRFIYLGKRGNFSKAFVSAFIGGLKQFNDMNYNQTKPEDATKTYGKIFYKLPRANFRKRKIYQRYRDRNMDDTVVWFSSKELATLFHFPDMNVKSPSITRVESKLSSAPANLPVE